MAVKAQSVSPSWELSQLLDIFPLPIRQSLVRLHNLEDIIEVVLDLGRPPEARFANDFRYLSETPVTNEDIGHVCSRISQFGPDNRAGIEQTLARYPGLLNRKRVEAHADAMLDGRTSVDFSLWRIISLGIWGRVFGATA